MHRHPTILALFSVGILLGAGAHTTHACMAIGKPQLRIIRSPDNDEHAVAFISMYSCRAMPPKSFCCIGIRFEQNNALRKARIRVLGMRFVQATSGQALSGFNPTKKEATARSFANELEGQWYGFWGLFPKDIAARGLTEIRVELTMAPGTTDADLEAAFKNCYVGTSAGNSQGVILKGEHHEILKLADLRVFGLPKEEGATRARRDRQDDQEEGDAEESGGRRGRGANRGGTSRDVDEDER